MLPRIDLTRPVNWRHPLNRGLVSWWLALPQWSGGLTWHDLARRNNGVLTNGLTWQPRPGGFGSLSLDGSDDYVDVVDAPGLRLTRLTLAGWFYPRALSGYNSLAAKSTNSWSTGWGLVYNPEVSGVGFFIGPYSASGGSAWASPGVVATGAWQHLAGTYDGATTRFYVNGVETASATFAGPVSDQGTNFQLGASGSGGLDANCLADDVRLWGRSLSAAEVAAVYADSRTGYASTLNRVRRRIGAAGPSGGLLLKRRRAVVS
jgi:hypothetical protein